MTSFLYTQVEVHGRAGTLNESGRNSQNQDAKHACMEKDTPRKKNCKKKKEKLLINAECVGTFI